MSETSRYFYVYLRRNKKFNNITAITILYVLNNRTYRGTDYNQQYISRRDIKW